MSRGTWDSVECLCDSAGSRATPLLLFARYFCAPTRASWDISCFFLLRCFCCLQLSPLPKLIVTVLEQACALGQIVGKLSEDHEHFDAFAAVLPCKDDRF